MLLDFFKMRVFNWIPEAIIGKDWRPYCPNCGKTLQKNGHGNLPMIVFDQCDNYFLNSPNKYICRNCEDYSKFCEKVDDKRVYNFTSSSSEILQQIGDKYPELIEIFPCYTTRQNAIDKKLMNLVIHNAVKGVGPVAMTESLASWHELEWQKKENQWGNFVNCKLNQPTVLQARINRSEIQKCPEYFSLQMGGCVPHGSLLVKMFCSVIKKMR